MSLEVSATESQTLYESMFASRSNSSSNAISNSTSLNSLLSASKSNLDTGSNSINGTTQQSTVETLAVVDSMSDTQAQQLSDTMNSLSVSAASSQTQQRNSGLLNTLKTMLGFGKRQ